MEAQQWRVGNGSEENANTKARDMLSGQPMLEPCNSRFSRIRHHTHPSLTLVSRRMV